MLLALNRWLQNPTLLKKTAAAAGYNSSAAMRTQPPLTKTASTVAQTPTQKIDDIVTAQIERLRLKAESEATQNKANTYYGQQTLRCCYYSLFLTAAKKHEMLSAAWLACKTERTNTQNIEPNTLNSLYGALAIKRGWGVFNPLTSAKSFKEAIIKPHKEREKIKAEQARRGSATMMGL